MGESLTEVDLGPVPERSPARGPASASQGFGAKVSSFFRGVILDRGGREPRIHFDPPRQILHGSHTLRVILDDPRGVTRRPDDHYGLSIRYHGHDVTRSFLMQAKVSRAPSGERLTLEVPWMRLSPASEHLIEAGYTDAAGVRRVSSRYGAPLCRAFEREVGIRSLESFRPDPELLSAIESISRQMEFNPALVAALIAQESGFDPKSVSLSRALGLTQITPLAEAEISSAYQKWPRYPGLNALPAPMVKALILLGEVNAANEWRLHPDRSIRGGLTYARALANRWLDSEQFSRVSWKGDTELARTRLMLASYNSGYARVSQAITRHGAAWLTAPELKEARKYVNRIVSYCDAFERAPSAAQTPPQRAPARTPKALAPQLVLRVLHENET